MADKEEVLSHFTTLETLFHMFEWGGIPLYDVSRWDDLADRAMVGRGCKRLGASWYGVMCFMGSDFVLKDGKTVDQCETYAHWKVYSKPLNVDVPSEAIKMGVRIDFYAAELKGVVQKCNADAVLGEIEYAGFSKYLDTVRKSNAKRNPFFVKRAAYLWENEFRLLVFDQRLSDVPLAARETGAKAFVPVKKWSKLIRNIAYSPLCKTESYPGAASTRQIKYYAKDALRRRMLAVKHWRPEAERQCLHFLEKGYRSGVLDNQMSLNTTDAAKRNKNERVVGLDQCFSEANECTVFVRQKREKHKSKIIEGKAVKRKGK